jgi:hypothetical protein
LDCKIERILEAQQGFEKFVSVFLNEFCPLFFVLLAVDQWYIGGVGSGSRPILVESLGY